MDEQTLKNKVINSRYRLIKKLGEGGMSVVYLGEDLTLNRQVAVKILKFEFLKEENLLENFKTEARAIAKLSHENIVNIYDVGVDGDVNYIIMELLEGITLKEYVMELNKRHEYMKNRDIVHISLQIARALQNAHNNGIIHKDIKPQNIVLSEGLKVKVTDFGIAQFIDQNTKIKLDREAGSVHYSSPEQLRCQIVDKRTDIYSFGILLYELATGKLPYSGEAEVQVALKHLEANFVSPSFLNSRLNPVIEKIIYFATERSKRKRFQSMDDIVDLFELLYQNPNEEFDFSLEYPELEPVSSKGDEEVVKSYKMGQMTHRSSYKEDMEDDVKEYHFMHPVESDETQSTEGAAQDEEQSQEDTIKDTVDKISKYEKINPNIEYIYRKREDDPGDEDGGGGFSTILKFIIVAILGIIIGAVILVFVFLPQIKDAEKDQPFILESIEGKSYTEAADILMKKGLMINKIKSEPSEVLEENMIISQSPDEGTTVKKGQTVNVVVSTGKTKIIMPSLKQKTLKEAQIRLENVKLNNINIVEEYNLLPKGMVISQNPEADSEVYSDTLIELVVSKGPETPKVSVPNLVGRSKDEAIKLLKDMNLSDGAITTAHHETAKEGEVIEQKVKAGTEVNEGQLIDFTISIGKDPNAKPQETQENQEQKPKPNEGEAQKPNLNETQGDKPKPNEGEDQKPQPIPTPQSKTFYVPLGTENPEYHIKVTVVKDGSETTIYDKTHKKEEEMVEISIKGSGVMKLRFYIDNELKKEADENFNQ